ncbi:MAG: pyrroline-5-carboxylate reductase [Planctomycetota bacterium]
MDALGFIGAGNMASALAAGIVKAGMKRPDQIVASDPDAGRREGFAQAVAAAAGGAHRGSGAARTTAENQEVLAAAKTVFLCIKPQMVGQVLEPLQGVFTVEHLIVTILAGTPAEAVYKLAGGQAAVVRAMPNTPMLIGQGAAAICAGPGAGPEHLATARRFLESSAVVVDAAPEQMNAVTALSGSGPAYLFYLAEAMLEAAQAMGLSVEQARTLTARTLTGSAALLAQSELSPAQLRALVTSPKGTTQAAVEVLDARSVRAAVVAAIVRARDRGIELSAPSKDN